MNFSMKHLITLSMVIGLCSTSIITEDQLTQLLNAPEQMNEHRQEYRPISGIEDQVHNRPLENFDAADETRVHVNDGISNIGNLVSKRPWCNGFTGCGRLHGKRSLSFPTMLEHSRLSHVQPLHASSVTESISKRPFCNGFFGCGNPGKRLVLGKPDNPKTYKTTVIRVCNIFGCLTSLKR